MLSGLLNTESSVRGGGGDADLPRWEGVGESKAAAASGTPTRPLPRRLLGPGDDLASMPTLKTTIGVLQAALGHLLHISKSSIIDFID